MEYHRHSGTEPGAPRIDWKDLTSKRDVISHSVPSTTAAQATAYGVFYIAPMPGKVVSIWEVHGTAATGGNLQLEKLSSGSAVGTGANVLQMAFNATATAKASQQGSVTLDAWPRQFVSGDMYAIKTTGALTNLNEVAIVMMVEYL